MPFRSYLAVFLFLVLALSCRHKKKLLSGEDPVEVGDFIESFAPVKPPFQFTDTLLTRKEKESSLISYKVFTQFVPDSAMRVTFGKGVKPKIYPVGRIETSDEQYLMAKLVSPSKKIVCIICFDKDEQFAGLLPLLQLDGAASTKQLAGVDRGNSFYKMVQRRNPDGSQSEGKDAYIFNAASRKFMLIMQEALDDHVVEVINPIDTLPRKNKYSADYGPDKKNLVSIRDHKTDPGKFRFFIHISKKAGTCSGELKGEAVFNSPHTAVYQQPGDPCILHFSFSSGAVVLKEEEGCGSRRDLDCPFDGTYGKRRLPVVKKAGTGKK
jgi:hypothetical protein